MADARRRQPLIDKRASYKNFALVSALRKCGIDPLESVDRDYIDDGNIRAVGLYQITNTDIVKSLVFLSKISWALMILTRKQRLELETGLERLYHAANSVKTQYGLALNWEMVAYENALSGDVVVGVLGTADEKWRSIVVSFDRNSPILNLLRII